MYCVGNGVYVYVLVMMMMYDVCDLCGVLVNSFGYRYLGYVYIAVIVARLGDSIEYFVCDVYGESDWFMMCMFLVESKDVKIMFVLFVDMGCGLNDDVETWRAYG